MKEDDDNPPAVISFFSKRAKFVPKVSTEEFQATSKLLDDIQEGKNKSCSIEDVEIFPFKRKNKKKVSAKEKNVDPAEITQEDNVADALSSTTIALSAAAKRRLRKLQKERDEELKSIEAANEEVLSALNSSAIEVEEFEEDNFEKVSVLTISYLSDISRLKCYEHEKFSTIFPKVADLFKLKVSEFLLCLREQNIKVDDTPNSLNILDTDILDCIPYKGGEKTEIEYDVDNLKLFFQSNDSKVRTEILVHKLEKLQDVMERYSKTRNIPLNQLIFEFDGERISGTETPEDMDMESGNCIDVKVLNPENKQTNKTTRKRNIKAEVVVTVDSDSNDSDILWD